MSNMSDERITILDLGASVKARCSLIAIIKMGIFVIYTRLYLLLQIFKTLYLNFN